MLVRIVVFLAITSSPLLAQTPEPVAAPPKELSLPKPLPPARPKPSTAYTQPQASKWDTPLLYSQLALASAGTGATTAAAIARYKNSGNAEAAIASIGGVGLSIILQRAYQPVMSDKTKKWLSIANFIAAGVLAGLATRDVDDTQETLNATHAP